MEEPRKVIFSGTLGGFTLALSSDSEKKKLFLAVSQPDAPALISVDGLKQLLLGKVHPPEWHDDVLREIAERLTRGEASEERRIGRGVAPVSGQEGRSSFLIKPFRGVGQLPAGSGRHNFRELHAFDNIEKGMVVARIFPPKPGTPGRDILGKELPAPQVKAAQILTDASIVRRTARKHDLEYEELVAEREGVLIEQSGKWSISQELILREGIDLSLGSVRFIGKVVVQGDVAEGLAVSGRDGVTINGATRNSHLSSLKGEVVLKGFAHGCTVQAETGVVVSAAHECGIESKADLQIEKEAFHCRTNIRGAILGTRARIRGGQLRVVLGVEARELGSPAGEATEIRLCTKREVGSDLVDLDAKEAQLKQALESIRLHLGPLLGGKGLKLNLSPRTWARIQHLQTKVRELERALGKVQEELSVIRSDAERPELAPVSVHERAYPGVVLVAGEERYSVGDPPQGRGTIEYSAEKRSFEVVPFKAVSGIGPASEKAKEKKR